VKRDDLIGPGMGGNKVRKLEFLIADAQAQGADRLMTVGAGQSNHARLTAALGMLFGLPTDLVLGGRPSPQPSGNQLLAKLFGARMHYPGTDDWAELESAQQQLAGQLQQAGHRPYLIPIGGSTPIGALGFAAGYDELLTQCAQLGFRPAAVVHATSSGGTHAGMLAAQACYRADGLDAPDIVAVSVAKTADDLGIHAAALARSALDRLGLPDIPIESAAVKVDGRWRGTDYAVPTSAGDAAVLAAARSGALVLDRVYTGKAFAGLLGMLDDDHWPDMADIVFWHTGGQPALFAPGGCPPCTVPELSHRA
jgi:1-aminocyclopropane-1-carboxylate deaminase/D-cysteine desulfhydrase-like pyridoxal-dependent ACC family enzyme